MATTRTQYALLFLVLFVPYTYFNHSDGWNTRLLPQRLSAPEPPYASVLRTSPVEQSIPALRRPLPY